MVAILNMYSWDTKFIPWKTWCWKNKHMQRITRVNTATKLLLTKCTRKRVSRFIKYGWAPFKRIMPSTSQIDPDIANHYILLSYCHSIFLYNNIAIFFLKKRSRKLIGKEAQKIHDYLRTNDILSSDFLIVLQFVLWDSILIAELQKQNETYEWIN